MHIMLDLETMGTRPDAPIIAIGAVAFDKEGVHESFYEVLDLAWAVRDGAVMSPETVIWWLQQSDEARSAVTRRGIEPRVALRRFGLMVEPLALDGMWGNGASFDNVILSETYLRLGMKAPWSFRKDKCYRTAKGMYPAVEINRSGTHHNALDDARSQAEHLIAISAKHGDFL